MVLYLQSIGEVRDGQRSGCPVKRNHLFDMYYETFILRFLPCVIMRMRACVCIHTHVKVSIYI